MGYTRADWTEHYNDGRGFRQLGDEEKGLLLEHAPAPESGSRALDACCGTGEMAAYLASLGYMVDAADFAEGALDRARAEHPGVEGLRWLRLDIEHDDLADLHDGYALIVIRLSIAFLRSRTYILRRLAARLGKHGKLIVITPLAEHTPEKRRHIALDEDELAALTDGFNETERFDAEGLAVLVLRGRGGSFSAEEKSRPDPQAVFGAAMVVTDAFGRVLLGRSTRGMWELPGGRIEAGEAAEAAAVRELSEESGLTARTEDAHVVTVLHDDWLDVRRITAVVRITGWEGELGLPEPHRFVRWEWHDLNTLHTLGKIFAPSAQALTAVWPGVLPGLPSVHSYPCATVVPPVPGEPAEAVRYRQQMTETVVSGGWAPSQPVRDALQTVPRHRFVPEVNLATAYDGGDRAVITRRDEAGTAISSVSAAWLQADMIEQLRLEPGMTVLEVGSGGYNGELLAHVLGPLGRVVTVDVDPYVVRRTQRLCAEAGSGRVTAVLGDGGLGAPAHVPAGGFDGVMITHNAADIAPAWRDQLSEGARLVVPLEMGGYTRSLTLVRRGDVLHCEHWTYCGFVRDRGAAARTAPAVRLADGEVTVRWEDGEPGDTTGLEEALRGARYELTTGLVVSGTFNFETLQVYAATTLPGFCRLAAREGSTLVAQQDATAMLSDGSLAYLTYRKVKDAPDPADRLTEFFIHAYGPAADELAERFADCVRTWDHKVRERGYPPMTVHPAGTPDEQLPAGDVLDKPSARLVFQWPGRVPDGTQDLLAVGGRRT
ncbi:methyltransferase, FxLD system [Streptomyces sp. So13.3]|uniref:methyltransferase, FxLD system n=1 Tax=Streptomyces sp. So13.3 TaxID=2136173 RepID=UPI001107007B|nr:methyltransferase, FxLD system [Streptomyces sp. So13.3]QNA72059.1 methyltransferase, FxLD system [Streptomyces sp. So13.3]